MTKIETLTAARIAIRKEVAAHNAKACALRRELGYVPEEVQKEGIALFLASVRATKALDDAEKEAAQ